MYPATSLFVAVGQLAIAILVLFSYPLQVQPCRNCLDKVFHFGSAIDKTEEDVVEDEHMSGEMTPLKYTLLTSAVVAGGFSIAYFVDNLEMGMPSLSSRLCVFTLLTARKFCPLSELQGRQLFRSSSLGCSTGRQVLRITLQGCLLTHDLVTVDKGRPEQEQASQPGGSCPDVLWHPHSHLLVGRHVVPADISFFF